MQINKKRKLVLLGPGLSSSSSLLSLAGCVFVVMKTQVLLVCCFYVRYNPKAMHTNYKGDAAIGGPGFDITARPPFEV